MRCCLCERAAVTVLGGNALCEEHLAEAKAEAGVVEEVRADIRDKDGAEDKPLRHNPFDENCVRHSTHPVRDGAVCEICNAT